MKQGGSPSAPQVHKAALFARKNADRFFRDAKLLLKSGSAAHAYGMLVLAEEEMGKAIVFHLYADGYLRNQEWLWLATKKHEMKHAAMIITIIMRLFLFVFLGLDPMERGRANKRWITKTYKGLAPAAIINKRLRDTLDNLLATANTIATVLDEIGQLGQMQDERERGFYVDFQPDGRPMNPLSINIAMCRQHMKLVAVRMEACRVLVGSSKISLKNRQRLANVPKEARVQIAALEVYLFGKKGLYTILSWLKGPGPKSISETIREYSRDKERITQLQAALEAVIKKQDQEQIQKSLSPVTTGLAPKCS